MMTEVMTVSENLDNDFDEDNDNAKIIMMKNHPRTMKNHEKPTWNHEKP